MLVFSFCVPRNDHEKVRDHFVGFAFVQFHSESEFHVFSLVGIGLLDQGVMSRVNVPPMNTASTTESSPTVETIGVTVSK